MSVKSINKHLAKKKDCRSKYTEEEMQATSKMLTSARQKRFEKANRKERAKKLKAYKLKNKEVILQKHREYNKQNQTIIAQKQKIYDQRNKKHIALKMMEYQRVFRNKGTRSQQKHDVDWCDVAGKELLQEIPRYKRYCGRETRREIMWMSPEQLVDSIYYYKEKGHPEYQDVIIDYGFMSISPEIQVETDEHSKSDNKQKTNTQHFEVGLSNKVIIAGETFNGKKVTEDINVILKLRTLSSQPEAEKEDGSSWCIDPEHLIQAVKFWKKKDLICLRGIRFPNIMDMESESTLTESQRRDNEEKVIKSWKYLLSKPYNLLARYHKSFLEEVGITSEEEWNSK